MRKYKLSWKYPIDPVTSVSITADGCYIAVGCSTNGTVYLLKNEGDRGDLVWGYGTGDASVNSVAVTPDGNYIAAGTQGSRPHLLNREGKHLWDDDREHGWAIFGSIALTPDGNYIVARDNNGFEKHGIYLFNKEGEVLWTYEICGSFDLFSGSVSITHDGASIAASGDNGKVYLLNGKGNLLRTYKTGFDRGIEDVAITPDGNYIAAGDKTAIYLLNKEGELLWRYKTGRITSNVSWKFTEVAITSDGNYIAAATTRDYGEYKLSLLKDGLLMWHYRFDIPVLPQNRGPPGRVVTAISPDGKYIVAGGSDKNVYLFQLLNEQEAINSGAQMDREQEKQSRFPIEIKGNTRSPIILGSIEDAFIRAKIGKCNLDIATLNSFGFDVGTIVEFEDGRRYLFERQYFGSPECVQVRELVRPRWKDTDLENKTEEYLIELGFKEHVDYEKQYGVSEYWIDFAFVNEKVAVEPGADYWHPKEKDKAKEKSLEDRGWEVLWFNEDAIHHGEEGVKRKIREVVMRRRG
ncbi:MAG: DUF559 domain-containing protein [Methanomicrobia archaeon]|nr:DUF559 domain-containing protein [Methanomicrobia archaeon]